jgi:DNA-binding transcriptional LysR family regulator
VITRNLSYLVALTREGHFGRAASACGVSQPTLSAGIRRLEADVGLPLVRRGRRYDGLTAEGERVLEWAQRILAACDGFQGAVDALRHGLRGQIRLGAIPTSLSSVSLITNPLCALHPELTVSIRSLNSRQIERGLHDLELELGLTYLDNEPLSGVRSLPLYREQYLLLTPATGVFERRAAVRWEEAATLPLCLLTEDMQNRRIVNGLFAEAGVEPHPSIETNSISTLYTHVRTGSWSSVISHAWLHAFGVPDGIRAIPLVEPEATRAIGLVVLDREPEAPLARAFLDVAAGLDLEAVLAPPDPLRRRQATTRLASV